MFYQIGRPPQGVCCAPKLGLGSSTCHDGCVQAFGRWAHIRRELSVRWKLKRKKIHSTTIGFDPFDWCPDRTWRPLILALKGRWQRVHKWRMDSFHLTACDVNYSLHMRDRWWSRRELHSECIWWMLSIIIINATEYDTSTTTNEGRPLTFLSSFQFQNC
jgi:hypothetical protein